MVHNLQVTLKAGATSLIPDGNIHGIWAIFQNNGPNPMRLGGSDVTLTKGVELAAGGPAAPKPPGGPVEETSTVQWPVAITDIDIALLTPPTTVVVGSVFLVDQEYMIVNDVSNADNPGVTRGDYGSVAAVHAAGAAVSIYGVQVPVEPAPFVSSGRSSTLPVPDTDLSSWHVAGVEGDVLDVIYEDGA